MTSIIIHTDGACSGNPGPGGWAYIIKYPNQEIEGSGRILNTTNNQMELLAVLKALERVQADKIPLRYPESTFIIHTDSQYVQLGITEWSKRWVKNGFRTASNRPVKNKDMWVLLIELSSRFKINWCWVKGHDGNLLNERCDQLARDALTVF